MRTAVGVLRIGEVSVVSKGDITQADAQAAGYQHLSGLLKELDSRSEGEIYSIGLKLESEDPRIAKSQNTVITPEELMALKTKLEKWDQWTPKPWTLALLRHLTACPGTRAVELAELLGLEKEWLKTNIRKLKELGLTISLQSGYEISPRGQAFLQLL